MDSIGCRACHALAPDEVAGQLGANKDIAPNLSQVAAKTDGRWLYHWIKNPRGYSDVARMPSLRLIGRRGAGDHRVPPDAGGEGTRRRTGSQARLADPTNIAGGEKLVRKFGCPGCHDIPGMESESRIGAELSAYGGKSKEELFFGDRTDLEESWDTFTFHKIKEPRGYATKWIEQVMPQFDLEDEDIYALRVFLPAGPRRRCRRSTSTTAPGMREMVQGRRLVARYNCTGCHIIEGQGGNIRRLYEDNLSHGAAEPARRGPEGAVALAVQLPEGAVRRSGRGCRSACPRSGSPTIEATRSSATSRAIDQLEVPFVHIEKAMLRPDYVQAGEQLASKDYLSCFSRATCAARRSPRARPTAGRPTSRWRRSGSIRIGSSRGSSDPQKLMPGTKMPTFYADPNATDGPPDILDGNDDEQIRALRDYVMSLGLPPHARGTSAQTAAATP